MMRSAQGETDTRPSAWLRISWTIVSFVLVEVAVCGLSAVSVLALWSWLIKVAGASRTLQVLLFAISIVPSYLMFAIMLMIVSPLLVRLIGWRTPQDAEMRIAEMGWPLLRWARYVASNHVVRVLVGTIFRGSPLWTAHLRLAGARLGRRVYVNSLALNDYNLLDFDDDVVIGGDVHLSGHTVEAGVIKTATVRLGRNTTIGLGSIIEIAVESAPNCEVAALSFVPKGMKLECDALYAGIPAKRIR